MTDRLVNGLPRQLTAMWENRRCSILFHLLVPGGKCRTAIDNPVRLANLYSSSHFHSRIRGPLLPPASAVISSEVAVRYLGLPISFHQRLIALTAKLAVSWVMPMLTQPSLRARS